MALVETRNSTVQQTAKFLAFRLADEEYGCPVQRVQEIIQWTDVTRVPRLPVFIQGVINLRGKVIPVLNLRRRFGLPEQEATARTCIVVLQIEQEQGRLLCGAVVDTVTDVVDLPTEHIEKAPEFGASVDTAFLAGIGQLGPRVIILLDVERILDRRDWTTLEQAAAAATDKGAES
jgi:purine-binding chemotaxis protein CheW